jgi:hypothetical protein
MDEGDSRIQVIEIDTNASPICLINVYLPSDNKEMGCEYKDMISQLRIFWIHIHNLYLF